MHMNSAPHLLTEDRPDFQHVLGDALRIVLDGRDGGAPLNSEQLRTKALAAADAITAMVTQEYGTYLALRTKAREAVRESARAKDSRAFSYAALGVAEGAASGAGIAAVMAVLTPLLAGAAAVIFLLIGYALRAVSPEPGIAHPLRTAGWFFAAVAAAAVLLGAVGLLLTALRDSSSAIHDSPDALPPEVAAAREAWREALLARALLPFLTDALDRAVPDPTPAPAPTTSPHLPRLGYSRPDFTSPQTPRTEHGTD
jgi:hypothetical protein